MQLISWVRNFRVADRCLISDAAAYHIEDEIQDDDGENSMDAKHITRWWRRCLELIETLIQDGCGLVFDNVRQFLLQFNQYVSRV